MNKVRRNQIELLHLKITEILDDLAQIYDEESVAHDNTPESFQDTEKYQESEDALYAMDDARVSLENVLEQFTSIWDNV